MPMYAGGNSALQDILDYRFICGIGMLLSLIRPLSIQ